MMVMPANQTGTRVGLLAGAYPGSLGHLYSIGQSDPPWKEIPFALDNGAFPAWEKGEPWNESAWRALLRWAVLCGQAPLWALVPDVVKDREATIAAWHRYSPEVRRLGFRPAFAIQNGMTFEDVPADDCMLFIGGDDAFKDTAVRPWCARFPGRVHVARVNGHERLLRCYHAGAVSIDGTGWFSNAARARRTGSVTAATLLEKFIVETYGKDRSCRN